MEYIIGVDIGTTSTKAIAFDFKGNILSKKNIEYPIINPEPSWSEQDSNEIFEAVLNSIKYVVRESRAKGGFLSGISFSSAMHSLIGVDGQGSPLTNCIIWADTRSKGYAEDFKKSDIGHEIYMKTGTPIHPMSPLCKIAWIKDNLKDIFNKVHKFISIKEYVFYKLFGEYLVDYSIASATGLFDIYSFKWNDNSLNISGIDRNRLSEPVTTTYLVKGMKKEYADFMDIDKDTPFIVGASDGCLANLGTNAIRIGSAAVTVGTSGAVRVISDKPKTDRRERLFSYILSENHYVIGGPVNSGGIVFRWFRDNFSQFEIEEALKRNVDPYEILTEKAASIAPGCDGLVFLPYLLGERAPNWDPDSRGVFFGINITHTREHFLRALLEGVIYGLYSVGKALEETSGNINTIYATGGFIKSSLWVQMLSDVFNKKVLIAESHESSCFGAAILGMKALGILDNLEEAEKFVPISNTYYPNEGNRSVYEKRFGTFQRLYEKLKDEFAYIQNV